MTRPRPLGNHTRRHRSAVGVAAVLGVVWALRAHAMEPPRPFAQEKPDRPATSPDFMAALRKALSRSEALLEHAHSADLIAELSHRPHPVDTTKAPQLTLTTANSNWWEENHLSLTASVSNHDGSRAKLAHKSTCVQDSDTFCEGADQLMDRDPSLLLNGFADLRVAYGANIGLNVRF